METAMTRWFCCFFSVLLLSGPSHEADLEFNYVINGERGPLQWGDLRPEWIACKTGKLQSPIDLSSTQVEVVSNLGALQRTYRPSNAALTNRGQTIMLQWEGGGGTLVINGIEYELKQCHWHTPSEHTIDGKGFVVEAHMVHESRDGKFAVVAIVYNLGAPNPFLASISNSLGHVSGPIKGKHAAVGVINPTDINIETTRYYRYEGSLTTPPCTENVVWTIVQKVESVTSKQVKLLRAAVHYESNSNARPSQPLNGRAVKLNMP